MKRTLFKYLLSFAILMCFLQSTLNAQQYNFKNFTPKNGLASSIVNSIFQDSNGYVWFGTQGGGVSRFNGKVFKNFNKESGLVDNDVTYITEDKRGNIWIATSGGVSKFDGVTFTNYTQKDGLASGVVYCIYVDEKNTIWFAVQDGGVNIYDGKNFINYTTEIGVIPNASNFFCTGILKDKEGNIWFKSLSTELCKFEEKTFKFYQE